MYISSFVLKVYSLLLLLSLLLIYVVKEFKKIMNDDDLFTLIFNIYEIVLIFTNIIQNSFCIGMLSKRANMKK